MHSESHAPAHSVTNIEPCLINRPLWLLEIIKPADRQLIDECIRSRIMLFVLQVSRSLQDILLALSVIAIPLTESARKRLTWPRSIEKSHSTPCSTSLGACASILYPQVGVIPWPQIVFLMYDRWMAWLDYRAKNVSISQITWWCSILGSASRAESAVVWCGLRSTTLSRLPRRWWDTSRGK